MGDDSEQFQCFCPAKDVIPLRKRLPMQQHSYGAALSFCQEAHEIHGFSANLVVKHLKDLNLIQKLSANHKITFDKVNIEATCFSDNEEEEDDDGLFVCLHYLFEKNLYLFFCRRKISKNSSIRRSS